MTIVDWLTKVNGSYLVALALVVFLLVEGLKTSEQVSSKFLPLVASLIGVIIGLVIGVIYQESIVMTSLNGFIAGLLSAGSFDFMKAVWQLPREFK
ncbi:hypothetical protein I6N95_17580 [Vagococcus sp. BWB3-3]|uniref:Holin n=1 Tax=Vagococcus allomyrinae TaxID=2794353 RepID=A0A940PFY1_9ENTE|nr:holin [Vagococcus allomyrinae]MBP1042831.1 hypothetical protein [Vagococcus allomyrinae]